MRSALRATAVLASGSAIVICVGLVSAKVWALLVGPVGLGMLSVLQSIVAIGVTMGTLGAQTGVVRIGASALARGDAERFSAVRTSATWIACTMAVVAVVLFWSLRRPFAALLLGDPRQQLAIACVGIAISFSIVAGIQNGVLNAQHRVSALTRVSIGSSILGTAASLALIWRWRESAIPIAVIAMAVASWLATSWYLSKERRLSARPTRRALFESTNELLKFGGPYVVSSLVGAGVLQALPLLVNYELSTESVGFYRAANAIAVGYLGFLLTAMGQDYYPRIAAARESRSHMEILVNEQLRLLTLIITPILLLAQVATPYIISIAYSHRFVPAAGILRWQLIGDLFKFWSWAFAFGILARCSSSKYLFTEFVAGVALLVGSWTGMKLLGLAGLGTGYAAAYVVYFVVTWSVLRAAIGLRLTTQNRLLMCAALGAALTVHFLSGRTDDVAASAIAWGIALISGLLCAGQLRREFSRETREVNEHLAPAAGTAE